MRKAKKPHNCFSLSSLVFIFFPFPSHGLILQSKLPTSLQPIKKMDWLINFEPVWPKRSDPYWNVGLNIENRYPSCSIFNKDSQSHAFIMANPCATEWIQDTCTTKWPMEIASHKTIHRRIKSYLVIKFDSMCTPRGPYFVSCQLAQRCQMQEHVCHLGL